MWPWRVKMPTQNLLRLLLLLMLVMRIVLATVCCRFGSWGLVTKLNFFRLWALKSRFFEVEVQARFWSWSLVSILLLILVKFNLDQDSEGLVKILNIKFSRNSDVWFRSGSWCLVEILKLKFDQDLCENHSNLGAILPLAMFSSTSILTLLYFSILLNHDGTIILETITELRTQKLFNLSIYLAFQPE